MNDKANPAPTASISHVCIFGGAGGLAGWVLMAATGGHLLPWPWYGSVPAVIFLGAMAAGMGVYVLANTDLSNAGRALFFAALCGLFFKPVFEAGRGFIGGAISQAQAVSTSAQVTDATSKLKDSLRSQHAEQVKTGVQETAQATTDLVSKTSDVSDPKLKQELEKKSASAVDTITAAAPAAPEAAVDNLSKIGLAAKQSGQTGLTLHVLDSLKEVEQTTTDPQTALRAQKAAAKIQMSRSAR
jgi:ribonuclease HII